MVRWRRLGDCDPRKPENSAELLEGNGSHVTARSPRSLNLVRRIRGQVLLRRARVNEVGFEIVNMDLESRYRLRRLIMEALEQNRDARVAEWDGVRK